MWANFTYFINSHYLILFQIQICGSVQCRLGVLLLSPQNVRVLGGEVDALVEANNQDAILAQAL